MQRGSVVFWETVSVPQVFPAFSQTTVKASNERQKDFFQGGGPLRDFSKIFPGGGRSGEICFFPPQITKTTFFAEIFKIQGGPRPPCRCPKSHGLPWLVKMLSRQSYLCTFHARDLGGNYAGNEHAIFVIIKTSKFRCNLQQPCLRMKGIRCYRQSSANARRCGSSHTPCNVPLQDHRSGSTQQLSCNISAPCSNRLWRGSQRNRTNLNLCKRKHFAIH